MAKLHLNYQHQIPPSEVEICKYAKEIPLSKLSREDLKVKKMKRNNKDDTKVKFNDSITITDIPKEAWDYKINGWSAPKWVIEKYQYKQDKNTDIINDPNIFSDDPAYVLKLFLSVITLSLKT